MKVFLFLCALTPLLAWSQTDQEADRLANKAFLAVGGPSAWESTRYLAFSFSALRNNQQTPPIRHVWDRWEGRYRVTWKKNADTTVTVLFNVQTQKGKAYYNGKAVPEKTGEGLITTAYRRFINDTYWLLVATKFFDPGVYRVAVPDSNTTTAEVFSTSFDNVGLTPKDRYWFWVDKESGRIQQWAYILQNNRDGKSTVFRWEGWETHTCGKNEISVATRKVSPINGSAILTDMVSCPVQIPPEVFENPEADF